MSEVSLDTDIKPRIRIEMSTEFDEYINYENKAQPIKLQTYRLEIIITFILRLLGVISLISYLVVLCNIDFNRVIKNDNIENVCIEDTNKNVFQSIDAREYKDIKYHGKENLLKILVAQMTKMIDLTEKDKNLQEKISATQRNFLLYGPPGTGKTHFVKKLAYELNKNLIIKYRKNEFNETKDIYNEDGYVRVYCITPSMITDKWYGETEKKVYRLFSEARDDSEWKATIIFLDEVDSYFSERSNEIQEYYLSLKAEFLNLMSGINENLTKNVFIIGATNLRNNLDTAFARRFSEHFQFGLPNFNEIKDIIMACTKKWYKEKDYEILIDGICTIALERFLSQSNIIELINNVLFKYTIDCKKLYSYLKDAIECNLNTFDKESDEEFPQGLEVYLYADPINKITKE